MGQAKRFIANESTSGWRPVTNGLLQGSVLGLVIFNFLNYLYAEVEYLFSNFANDTKLGGAVHSLEVRDTLQRDPNRLESWEITNYTKSNKSKYQILH